MGTTMLERAMGAMVASILYLLQLSHSLYLSSGSGTRREGRRRQTCFGRRRIGAARCNGSAGMGFFGTVLAVDRGATARVWAARVIRPVSALRRANLLTAGTARQSRVGR